MSEEHTMQNCGSPVTKYWCEDYAPDDCYKCPNWTPKKPTTNADWIKAMSDHELAVWLAVLETRCYERVAPMVVCDTKRFAEQYLLWLRREVDDADERERARDMC